MHKFFFILILSCFSFIAGAQRNYDVLHYRFSLELNDKSDNIKGLAIIHLKMKNNDPNIVLDLTNVNQKGKGMKVSSVSSETSRKSFSFRQEEESINIQLPEIKAGDTLSLAISYQ